jgi:hypothetical protein
VGWLIHKGIVLNLAVLSEGHTSANVCTASYDATLSQGNVFSNLGMVPNFCVVTERNPFTDIS